MFQTLKICFVFLLFNHSFYSQTFEEVQRFKLKAARQAVAVDDEFFYVINNSSITKHDKQTGQELHRWDGEDLGVSHLNSGIVIDGLLYCANSNYPESPMAGSIEIFDAKTLQHHSNHSFGIGIGSPTWVDQKDGFWYVGFAHYSGDKSSENKDTRWSQIVKFDKQWRRVEAYIFPKSILEKFMPMSNSGGAWVDDKLYVTGHDNFEVYVLKLPQIGFTMHHVRTLNVPFFGQGFTKDSSTSQTTLFGIIKKANEVVVARMK